MNTQNDSNQIPLGTGNNSTLNKKPTRKALVKFLLDSKSMDFSRAIEVKANRKGKKITFSVEFDLLSQALTAYTLIKQFSKNELDSARLYPGSVYMEESKIKEIGLVSEVVTN